MISKSDWKWFGNAGHLCVGSKCRFHLCTQVGGYLVSTVGEYWPEDEVRRIHAGIHDPQWLIENGHMRGDSFDAAYMKKFGFEAIGGSENDKYETMVFRAGKACTDKNCHCGMPVPTDWSELNCIRYSDAGGATKGHMAMCQKYARKP